MCLPTLHKQDCTTEIRQVRHNGSEVVRPYSRDEMSIPTVNVPSHLKVLSRLSAAVGQSRSRQASVIACESACACFYRSFVARALLSSVWSLSSHSSVSELSTRVHRLLRSIRVTVESRMRQAEEIVAKVHIQLAMLTLYSCSTSNRLRHILQE